MECLRVLQMGRSGLGLGRKENGGKEDGKRRQGLHFLFHLIFFSTIFFSTYFFVLSAEPPNCSLFLST
jgi:hypothetical protein